MATGFVQRYLGKINVASFYMKGVSRFFGSSYSANTATSATTLTVANITGSGDVVLNMTGTLTGAANATLPTVANLVAGLTSPPVSVNTTYRLRIINSSSGAFAWTVVTAAGWTLNGTMSVAQNTWRDFIVTVTALGTPAATLQSIGTGTYS